MERRGSNRAVYITVDSMKNRECMLQKVKEGLPDKRVGSPLSTFQVNAEDNHHSDESD